MTIWTTIAIPENLSFARDDFQILEIGMIFPAPSTWRHPARIYSSTLNYNIGLLVHSSCNMNIFCFSFSCQLSCCLTPETLGQGPPCIQRRGNLSCHLSALGLGVSASYSIRLEFKCCYVQQELVGYQWLANILLLPATVRLWWLWSDHSARDRIFLHPHSVETD